MRVYLELMARRPKRQYRRRGGRRNRRYIRGRLDEALSVAGLAAADVTSNNVDDTVLEKTLCTSIVVTVVWSDVNILTDSGPVEFGVAHSDYLSSEIEAYLENASSWNEGDRIQQEVSKRWIRSIGVFYEENDGDNSSWMALNGGLPMKVKLNWMLITGQTLKFWAYNHGTVAIAGSSDPIDIQGHANLWPR